MRKESFNSFKKRVRDIYNQIGTVYCPALKDHVYFNTQGFHHLNYKVTGWARTASEQASKLHQVKYIENIIKNAEIIDEVRLEKSPIGRKKKNGKSIIKDIKYTSVIGIVNTSPKIKIKVVVRKVGSGRTIFWSAMRLKK